MCNWVNIIAFHDLDDKYGQKTKIVHTKGKMVILHQNGRSPFLNPWWILSMKDQILKFWWFQDNFERVWNENVKKVIFGSFWKNSFFVVLSFGGYFGNCAKIMPFLEKANLGKVVSDF